MAEDPLTAPFSWTDHLVRLVGRTEAAAARVALAPPRRRAELALAARREFARLSARLDASPLDDTTADQVDAREAAGLPPVDALPDAGSQEAGGWAQALGLEGMGTQEVAAVEYANLLAAVDGEPELAGVVLERPLEVLARLQAEITRGLVAPEVAGRPRRTEQAISDGAQGRLLYRAPEPDAVPALLADLGEWIVRGAAGLPALVVAGVVHERLLSDQPFEAGNGRLARSASRVLLRAYGLDPDGLAVGERRLLADRMGYFTEVAATRHRRGDLTRWLERYGEAVADALESAADALTPLPEVAVPDRARDVADGLAPDATVTVREYAEQAAVGPVSARLDLERLSRAGLLELDPRSRGLRYRRARRPLSAPTAP